MGRPGLSVHFSMVVICFLLHGVTLMPGYGQSSGVVQGTSQTSFEDVASQIAADEATSPESTETVR